MTHVPRDERAPLVDRRDLLRGAGALGVGLFALRATSATSAAQSGGVLTPPNVQSRVQSALNYLLGPGCTLSPSATQGPFYLPLNLIRQDITEGQPGFPTRLILRIRRASDCTPIQGASVDVWHANVPGLYSGIASRGTAGQTWLRGIQLTDADGLATFDTVYPGWYPGRATHIHVKVNPTPTTQLTTQVYWRDRVSNAIYATAPYSTRGPNPTTNAQDGIFDNAMLMRIIPNPTGGAGIWTGMTITVA